MSDQGSKNVFDISAFKNKKKDKNEILIEDQPSLSNAEIETFLKVCEYLRNVSTDKGSNTTMIWIEDDELRIQTRHAFGPPEMLGDVEDGVEFQTDMILTGRMPFSQETESEVDVVNFYGVLTSVTME
jgi:hypothetical protein